MQMFTNARQTFKDEFGFFPAAFEATPAERTVFARDAVRPILERRARVVASLEQEAGDGQHLPVTAASHDEKLASFDRAYRIATELKLADKGHTYKDYLAKTA